MSRQAARKSRHLQLDWRTRVTLVCSVCEEVVEDAANWIDEEDMCNSCSANSTSPRYCCGGIYEEGEDTCPSCGEPL